MPQFWCGETRLSRHARPIEYYYYYYYYYYYCTAPCPGIVQGTHFGAGIVVWQGTALNEGPRLYCIVISVVVFVGLLAVFVFPVLTKQ